MLIYYLPLILLPLTAQIYLMLPTSISGAFPAPRPGPYKDIGYAFISSPAISPFTRSSPRFKNGHPALSLQQIGYAVFYPASPPKVHNGWFGSGYGMGVKGRVDWLSSPKEEVVEGYKRFLGDKAYWVLVQTMKTLMTRLQFSAYHTAPLLPPSTAKSHPSASTSSTNTSQSSISSPASKYSVIIFSHGLAGTRTTYSQYCQALASEGYVVLSIEHKDGSGPAVQVQEGAGDGNGWLHWTRHKDIEYDDGDDSSLLAFRTKQLDLRIQEVYEAFHSFKGVVAGDLQPEVHEASAADGEAFVESLRDKVDLENTAITGHSFGGATVLSILQSPPPASLAPIPVQKAIALDPWLEPMASASKHDRADSHFPPLLVANSPGFTVWNGHFERLTRIVQEAKGWLVTVMNGSHQSFSDFPLLLPPAGKAVKYLSLTHELSVKFLRGTLGEGDVLEGAEADAGKVERDDKGKMSFKGDVALHLRGERYTVE